MTDLLFKKTFSPDSAHTKVNLLNDLLGPPLLSRAEALLRQGVDPDIIRRASGLSEDGIADSESFLPPDTLDVFLWKILPHYIQISCGGARAGVTRMCGDPPGAPARRAGERTSSRHCEPGDSRVKQSILR